MARQTAPDGELTASGDIKVKGPQAIKEYYAAWISAFPDAKSEIKNLFTQGNQVVVEGVFVGTHDGTLKTPMGDLPATGRKVRAFLSETNIDQDVSVEMFLLADDRTDMTGFEES